MAKKRDDDNGVYRKDVTVEIVVANRFKVEEDAEHVSGYGHEAKQVNVEGDVVEITVSRNGNAEFGLHVKEDGSFIVTSYGVHTNEEVVRNLTFNNKREWK